MSTRRTALAALALLSVATGCASDTQQLTLVNESSVVLVTVNVAPVATVNWGPNLLSGGGELVLQPGESITFSLECNTYDVRVISEGSDACILPSIELCDATWAITDQDLESCDAPPAGECRISAMANGSELPSDLPQVLAGTPVMLTAEGCGSPPSTTFQWVSGGVDSTVIAEGAEYTFQPFATTSITLIVLEDDIQVDSLSITISVVPAPIASFLMVSDFQPTPFETINLEVQALQDTTLVPIMDAHPEVVSIDWSIIELVDFMLGDPAVQVLGETSSRLSVPPSTLERGRYEVHAVGRSSEGDILAAPAPLQFEVVP
jgi:hypothetical protein